MYYFIWGGGTFYPLYRTPPHVATNVPVNSDQMSTIQKTLEYRKNKCCHHTKGYTRI